VTNDGRIQDTDKPKYAAKSKQSQYDGGLRTPIMLEWPAKIRPTMSDTVVSSMDISPPLLDAVGFVKREGLQRVSLRDSAMLAGRNAVFGECFTHNSKDLANPSGSLRWRWVIPDEWKLIVPAAQNEPDAKTELYDLKADPAEEKEFFTVETDRVGRMRAILDTWRKGWSAFLTLRRQAATVA